MKHKKQVRFFLTENEQFLVQEMHCVDPMIAIKMHEHFPNRSHTTKVISGSILIHDDKGWQVVVNSGETIDLTEEHLKHEIITLDNETVFQNITPAERYSDNEVRDLMEINKEFEDIDT